MVAVIVLAAVLQGAKVEAEVKVETTLAVLKQLTVLQLEITAILQLFMLSLSCVTKKNCRLDLVV